MPNLRSYPAENNFQEGDSEVVQNNQMYPFSLLYSNLYFLGIGLWTQGDVIVIYRAWDVFAQQSFNR